MYAGNNIFSLSVTNEVNTKLALKAPETGFGLVYVKITLFLFNIILIKQMYLCYYIFENVCPCIS